MEEKVLFSFRETRKLYLFEYFAGFILLILAMIVYLRGIALPSVFTYMAVGISLLAMGSAEWRRYIGFQYEITPSKLAIINGVIKRDKKNVYFSPLAFIPDINMQQSRIERLLNYGTVFVRGGQGNTFEIKHIDQPHKVMKIIEKMIERSKGSMTESSRTKSLA